MRLKDFFVVSEGSKVTEKHLYRTLICSICSILLCMGCLAGTTWAWFVVSIENPGNEIQISSVTISEKIVNIDNTRLHARTGKVYDLSRGQYVVSASVAKDAPELKNPIYVNMSVAYYIDSTEPISTECFSFKFEYLDSDNGWGYDKLLARINIVEGYATVSFWPSWTSHPDQVFEDEMPIEIQGPSQKVIIDNEDETLAPEESSDPAESTEATDTPGESGTGVVGDIGSMEESDADISPETFGSTDISPGN